MSLEEDKLKITKAFIEGINISNVKLFEIIKERFNDVRPIFPLIEFILDRLSAVTDLAMRGCNWDAEIIYRSALEALIKLLFITSAEGEEKNIRLREYWEDLSEINSIKLSAQAKKSLKIAEKYDSDAVKMAFKPLVLSEEKEQELRTKWPGSIRRKVEQKWSFSEIIVFLANTSDNKRIEEFIGLGHNYRYASHVTHADETGVLIIKERQQRPNEEREIADFAHFIRLLSDSFFFCILIGLQVASHTKTDLKFFIDLGKSIEEASELGNKYLLKLQEDQSYDKFR